jgi:alpha-galactosidase
MKKNLMLSVILLLTAMLVNGQCEILFDKPAGLFTLKNNLFERKILIDRKNHSFYTTSFKDLNSGVDFCRKRNREFGFYLNNKPVIGGLDGQLVDYKSHEIKTAENGSKILQVTLSGREKSITEGIDITLFYEIYQDLPAVRKWMSIKNNTSDEITVTNPEWEITNLEIAPPGFVGTICTFADVYGHYGQTDFKPPFIGRTDDPAILVYDHIKKYGAIVGNEAPAILKRTSIYSDSSRISIGMGFSGEEFPFETTLKKGESFTSPKGFIILYQGDTWQNAFEGPLADFIRKYMGVQLFKRKQSPVFLYNTWNPFGPRINDKLIRDIADVTSRAGVEYLIIDDGWQNNYGDWDIDRKKFPDGLKPVCDYILSKGMKPGFWISIATANDTSRIAREHPEWFVRDKNGKIANLHGAYLKGNHTMNLSTPYFDYIKDKISYYVETCHIGYVKLDLASVYSSYKLNADEIGDYSSTNRIHKNKNESIYLLYNRTYQLMDELKAKFPDLYIDCTFELYGEIYGIDYSLIQHADGDWLSNIQGISPEGAIYMRKLCYERARVVPASALLIGNLRMEADISELNFLSLLSATPMMLGDPRTLTDQKIKWFKEWSDWAKEMEKKYNYTQFYQTSDVFSAPQKNGWDGCARINREKGGGILCFYRNISPESKRTFPIIWVDENQKYQIYSPLLKKVIGIYTGKQLKEQGITVDIKDENNAEILGIEKIN